MSIEDKTIDDLIYESGIIAQGCFDKYDVDALKKFAELIVQETIKELCQQIHWHNIDKSNNPNFYKAIEKTRKHFGVKE